MARLPQRFELFAKWLRSRAAGGSAHVGMGEMAALLTSPPWRQRAEPFVQRIDPPGEDGLSAIWLRGFERPLWWPAEMGQEMVYMLVSEQFDRLNWHYYQVPETRVTEGDVVVDCGASEGMFTFLAAPIAREVHAVEPLPRFIQCLEKSFGTDPNVTIVHALLGDAHGTAFIEEGGVGTHVSATGTVEVRVRTLDELFLEHAHPVTYLKADLEGAELPMLRGAAGLIREHLPKMSLTTYHADGDAEAMEEWLSEASGGRYRFRRKGITRGGFPVMLHAWAA